MKEIRQLIIEILVETLRPFLAYGPTIENMVNRILSLKFKITRAVRDDYLRQHEHSRSVGMGYDSFDDWLDSQE